MIKSYKITYKFDQEDQMVEYFCALRKENGRLIGISAQNNFYDEIVFNFSTPKSIQELEKLVLEGTAKPIDEFEFIDGFNSMLNTVKEEYTRAYGKRKN